MNTYTRAGLDQRYLAKLDDAQRAFAKTAAGVKLIKEFVFVKGSHLFIVGNTGSGKTQKGYWVVNWLKTPLNGFHEKTETQIWISTGKSNEILPLFCMEMPVRIIHPKGSVIDIYEGRDHKEIKDLELVEVSDPESAWWAVKRGMMNIFEFRNTITPYGGTRSKWMATLFESLATWTREGRMPNIFPFTLYCDETQWFLAGTRVSTESERVKTSEIVTENALEIRSAGGRLVFFAQDFKNITPASRENMTCTILCRGAQVSREDNAALSPHCYNNGWKLPARFRPNEGKFIHADGTAYPVTGPWSFPLFPKDEKDREWIRRVHIKYGKKYGENTAEDEIKDEMIPDLGRYAALAIPPEKQDPGISRSLVPEGDIYDD